MKTKYLLLCLILLVVNVAKSTLAQEDNKPNVYFFCDNFQGNLAIFFSLDLDNGKEKHFFSFPKLYDNFLGEMTKQRCVSISQKIQNFYQENQHSYLTTGRENGQYRICLAKDNGGNCQENLLLIYRKNQDPVELLQIILNIKVKQCGLNADFIPRLYFDIEDLLFQPLQLKPFNIKEDYCDRLEFNYNSELAPTQ